MKHWLICLSLAISTPLGLADSPSRPWGDRYRVILWCGDTVAKNIFHTNALTSACRELGATTLMTGSEGTPTPWLGAGFDYYVENVVNRGLCLKFRSSVTDWNAFVTGWAKTRDRLAFTRDYTLVDPDWRDASRALVRQTANRHAPFAPVLYDLRDELSTTVSANPFDYDFSPASLAAFRRWLATRYPSLGALNAAWLTAFPTWDAVCPFTTDEIKARLGGRIDAQGQKPDWTKVRSARYTPQAARAESPRWHLAPWCDFRTFMDDCLAETLDDLRSVSHAADPSTPVGIEGTQMPSAWGGYDLWKLSRALDWAEPYDITAARAILGSFMRGKPMLAIPRRSRAACGICCWRAIAARSSGGAKTCSKVLAILCASARKAETSPPLCAKCRLLSPKRCCAQNVSTTLLPSTTHMRRFSSHGSSNRLKTAPLGIADSPATRPRTIGMPPCVQTFGSAYAKPVGHRNLSRTKSSKITPWLNATSPPSFCQTLTRFPNGSPSLYSVLRKPRATACSTPANRASSLPMEPRAPLHSFRPAPKPSRNWSRRFRHPPCASRQQTQEFASTATSSEKT